MLLQLSRRGCIGYRLSPPVSQSKQSTGICRLKQLIVMSFSSFCIFCSGANLRLNFDISCVRSWKISCMQKHHQSPINTGILAILSPLVPLEKFVLIARKLHVFFLIFGDFASISSSILFLDSRLSPSQSLPRLSTTISPKSTGMLSASVLTHNPIHITNNTKAKISVS